MISGRPFVPAHCAVSSREAILPPGRDTVSVVIMSFFKHTSGFDTNKPASFFKLNLLNDLKLTSVHLKASADTAVLLPE